MKEKARHGPQLRKRRPEVISGRGMTFVRPILFNLWLKSKSSMNKSR